MALQPEKVIILIINPKKWPKTEQIESIELPPRMLLELCMFAEASKNQGNNARQSAN